MDLIIKEVNGTLHLSNASTEELVATIISNEKIIFNQDAIITKAVIMQIANILLDLDGYITMLKDQPPTLF